MKYGLILVFVILWTAGFGRDKISPAAMKLMNIDREFSKLSIEQGAPSAFAEYADTGVIKFEKGTAPIVGRDRMIESFEMWPEGAELRWEPFYAEISESEDLGYTLGHYYFLMTDSSGETHSSEGNYVTIWKKQTDGQWKFVFDTGDTGPAPEEF